MDETGDPGMSEYPTLIPNDDTMDSDLEVDYPACTTGIIAQIGDGTCNTLNNNMECGEFWRTGLLGQRPTFMCPCGSIADVVLLSHPAADISGIGNGPH